MNVHSINIMIAVWHYVFGSVTCKSGYQVTVYFNRPLNEDIIFNMLATIVNYSILRIIIFPLCDYIVTTYLLYSNIIKVRMKEYADKLMGIWMEFFFPLYKPILYAWYWCERCFVMPQSIYCGHIISRNDDVFYLPRCWDLNRRTI